MQEELTEIEQAQLRRIVTLQKIVVGIIAKWGWLLFALFLIHVACFGSYLTFRAIRSVERFEAKTRLLYNPREAANIKTINDKQLMSIIDRVTLKRRVGEKVDIPMAERECLSVDMKVTQEKKPTNLFTISAKSQSWKGAVKKANAYAEIIIDEYVEYRTKDLDGWSESLAGRRQGLLDQFAEIEAEEAALKAKTGVLAPQEALLALNALISDQRRNASALGVDAANEELKRRKLEAQVGDSGKTITENAQAIHKRADAIAAIDKELVQLRDRYTDINPKVCGKLAERNNRVAEMREFLKSKGAENIDIENIDQLERSAGELADCMTRLETIAEKRRAIEQEISDNEKRASELASLIPEYERVQTRKQDVTAAIRELDVQINDIRYVQGTLRNDLRQIERAGGAGDKGPFGAKQVILSLVGAAICCGVVMLWIVVLEFVFGKVRGGREVSAYDEISFLGSVPKKGALPDDEEREVMGVVSLKMFLANVNYKSALLCRLPGAVVREDFMTALDFTASMSGMSGFLLDIVSGANFTPPEGAEQMISLVRKGNRGWFVTANRFVMAPTELQLLMADIAELRNAFDNVFIRMEEGVRTGGTFFDQLLGLCDSVILVVGENATPRGAFRYVRRHVASSGKPIMAIATGASAKTLRNEMEARI